MKDSSVPLDKEDADELLWSMEQHFTDLDESLNSLTGVYGGTGKVTDPQHVADLAQARTTLYEAWKTIEKTLFAYTG